jgi:HAD superfamily hydrolase (TIGR01458 family)
VKSILFDLDGVLYTGNTAIDGAADVVNWCNDESIPHLFLTNTTSRPVSALVEKLAGFGISATQGNFMTPALAAGQWLRTRPDAKIALFIPEATRNEFAEFDQCEDESERNITAVIVGDLGEAWDFNTLNRAFRMLMNNTEASLLALGMTRYWRAEDGLRLDAAPFVKALEHATGREAIVLGKPARNFYTSALARLGSSADETVMIGDDIKGDIGGSQNAGIRGLLVKTGKFQPADLELDIKPFGIIDSIKDLPEWWRSRHS